MLKRMDAMGREVYAAVLTAPATASHVWGDVATYARCLHTLPYLEPAALTNGSQLESR